MALRTLAPAFGASAVLLGAGTLYSRKANCGISEVFLPVAQTEASHAPSTSGDRPRDVASSFAPFDWDWDKRNSMQSPSAGSRTLFLVRHGQYRNPTDGFPDSSQGLTDLGRKQALETGKRLAAMTQGKEVKAIHCSTMLRARETAELIAQSFPGVPVLPTDLLREGAPCRPEPDTWKPREDTVFQDSARIEAAFRSLFYREVPGDSSSAAAAGAKADKGKAAAAARDAGKAGAASAGTVEIVVCHGNVIRYMALRALQLPPQAWLRLAVNNGSYTTVSIRPNGGVSLSGLGECGHFAPGDVTYS